MLTPWKLFLEYGELAQQYSFDIYRRYILERPLIMSRLSLYWLNRQAVRLRSQMIGGFLVAVLLPTLIRSGFTFDGIFYGNNFETMIGLSFAFAFGHAAQRRFSVYPGSNSNSYVIISYTSTFAILISIMFFLRIDYVRSIIIIGYITSIFWTLMINKWESVAAPKRFAWIEGRDMRGPLPGSNLRWVRIESPSKLPPRIHGVVVDLRTDFTPEWERCIANAAFAGIPVYHIKNMKESLLGSVEIAHLSENTLGSLNPNGLYLKAKEVFDFFSAALALALLLPVFIFTYIAIRVDSPGPGFFVQTRTGYRGRKFNVFKFRTMHVNVSVSSSALEEAITRDGDPRITRIGKLLRRTRIDELPQILNILRGEMSWIGPRPEALALSEWYERELPFYRYRHIVKPGITGWAQVTQGHVSSVEDVLNKLHFDFYYIKNFSFFLDALIFIRTIKTVIGGSGAR